MVPDCCVDSTPVRCKELVHWLSTGFHSRIAIQGHVCMCGWQRFMIPAQLHHPASVCDGVTEQERAARGRARTQRRSVGSLLPAVRGQHWRAGARPARGSHQPGCRRRRRLGAGAGLCRRCASERARHTDPRYPGCRLPHTCVTEAVPNVPANGTASKVNEAVVGIAYFGPCPDPAEAHLDPAA